MASDAHRKAEVTSFYPEFFIFIRRLHMNSFEEVFENIKQYIRDNEIIPDIAIKTWLEPLKTRSFDGKSAIFTVDSDFQKRRRLRRTNQFERSSINGNTPASAAGML